MFTKRNIEIIDLIGVLIALVAANPNLEISDMLDDFSDTSSVTFGDAEFTIITGLKCREILEQVILDSQKTSAVDKVLDALEKERWVNLET